MPARPLAELPTVVTCFAFREEYFPELRGMISTIKRNHPDWPLVVGRGTPMDSGAVVFDIEAPTGPGRLTLPVSFHPEGGEDDWRRITRMKACWLHEVWHRWGGLASFPCHRVMWLDADARCTAPLIFEIDPETEAIAGPWWRHPDDSCYDTITTGLLLLQGTEHGPVAEVLARWSRSCVAQIKDLGPPLVPWPEGDQEVLTRLLAQPPGTAAGFQLLKLDHDTYCGIPLPDGKPRPGALVDHWMMSAKMGRKNSKRGPDWPPPEHLRRTDRQ
jgi:hypothetical protein